MNRLSTYTILVLAFFTLGTFGLIGASIADSIALIGGQRQTDTSVCLLIVSGIHFVFGIFFIVLQWNDIDSTLKVSNPKDEKDKS